MSGGIPKAFEPYLRIGTCSWKYDSWKGLYYEADKRYKPFDYLTDYSKHLNSVEIDQWFCSLFPGGVKLCDPDTVKRYAVSVPGDFTFTVQCTDAALTTVTQVLSIHVEALPEEEEDGCTCAAGRGASTPAHVLGCLLPYLVLCLALFLGARRRRTATS